MIKPKRVEMNERIEKLAEQCWHKWYINDVEVTYPDIFVKQFAELIVKECVSVCEEQREMYAMLNETAVDDPTFAAMTTAATSLASGIKKHFGVE